MIDGKPRIGDEVYIHGYIDEIRNDVVIIRNEGGYFGTVPSEVFCYEEDRNGYGTMNSADTPHTDLSTEEFVEGMKNLKMEVKQMDCNNCAHWEHGAGQHYYCALLEMGQECYFESKDESTLMFANVPQTDCYMCKWMGDRDVCGRCRNRNLFAVADTPQTDCPFKDVPCSCGEQDECEWHTELDAPQTDCGWK